jgi:hypothetical protein
MNAWIGNWQHHYAFREEITLIDDICKLTTISRTHQAISELGLVIDI